MNRIRGNDERQWEEIINNALDKRRFADVTSDATPDTEFSFEHGLRYVPNGFIVIKQDKAADTYTGTTAWNTERIYLRTNVGTVALRVMVF